MIFGKHLRNRSARCLTAIRAFFRPMGEGQVVELQRLDAQESKDLRQRGLYPEKAVIPAARSATPLIPPQDPEMRDPVEPPSVAE
eukprot:1684520-Pyramimonas_sp.AAC.1